MTRKWLWCSRCQRCFEADVVESDDEEAGAKEIDELPDGDAAKFWRCGYDDCDATRVDAIPWIEVREQHPEYPGVPETGKVYPADTSQLAV